MAVKWNRFLTIRKLLYFAAIHVFFSFIYSNQRNYLGTNLNFYCRICHSVSCILTLNTEIRLNKSRRMRRYLAFIKSRISFIRIGNAKSPIIGILKIDTKSCIATVGMRTNGQQLQMLIILFTFHPWNLCEGRPSGRARGTWQRTKRERERGRRKINNSMGCWNWRKCYCF